MALTHLSSFRVGTGVSTGISTLLVYHAFWARMCCNIEKESISYQKEYKTTRRDSRSAALRGCLSHRSSFENSHNGKTNIDKELKEWAMHGINMAYLRQKYSVLHSSGLPPACTHCLEYSAIVLHRQKDPEEPLQWHKSFMQTSTNESMETRPLQSLNTELEKISRQKFCGE